MEFVEHDVEIRVVVRATMDKIRHDHAMLQGVPYSVSIGLPESTIFAALGDLQGIRNIVQTTVYSGTITPNAWQSSEGFGEAPPGLVEFLKAKQIPGVAGVRLHTAPWGDVRIQKLHPLADNTYFFGLQMRDAGAGPNPTANPTFKVSEAMMGPGVDWYYMRPFTEEDSWFITWRYVRQGRTMDSFQMWRFEDDSNWLDVSSGLFSWWAVYEHAFDISRLVA